MKRHTAQKVLFVAAAVTGLTVAGAGTATADHGDDDFRFDDSRNRSAFDNRGFDCFGPVPICVVDDHGRRGGRGHH